MVSHSIKKDKLISYFIIFMYALIVGITMYYHEPWFDEAQAWLIARDVSIKDLFTTYLRYEGHPPLWYLILMPFAKLGVPYEIGIKLPTFIFAVTSVALLVLRSPFPKLVKYSLPFTFFILYQFAVISRPYSLMMLLFWIIAILFPERNEKPYKFIIPLSVLCLTHSYGILISLGISIAWIIEILLSFKMSIKNRILTFIKDKRFKALFILLIINMLILYIIFPTGNSYAEVNMKNTQNLNTIFYTIFILPLDALFDNILINRYSITQLNMLNIPAWKYILGALILVIFLHFSKNIKEKIYIYLPLLFMIIFFSLIYFYPHHIGLYFLFIIWGLWICNYNLNLKLNKLSITIICILIGIIITWQSYFAFNSIRNDIIYNYDSSKEIAKYIKDYNLDKYNIMNHWSGEIFNGNNYTKIHPNQQDISFHPYFNQNILYNLNISSPKLSFITHINSSDSKKELDNWRKYKPDIIISESKNLKQFNNFIGENKYILGKKTTYYIIYKTQLYPRHKYVFIEENLAKKLGISAEIPN